MTIERSGDFRRLMFDPDELEDELDEEGFFDDDDDDYRFGPRLFPDCLSRCLALETGICCKDGDDPLVRCAVDLADLVDLAVRRLEDGCRAAPAAELAYRLKLVPGLLAQIHAIAPGLGRTAATQLQCPVGRLFYAAARVTADGCPWGCDDPQVPDRRAELAELRPLLADSLLALSRLAEC